MKEFIAICSLFVFGSLAGWVLELLFRRFFSQHKWMNPGFLVGPYLPIYGTGIVCLYGIMQIPLGIENFALDLVCRAILIGVGMTVIELIAGLIFIKGLHIKLWDYSDRWGNFKGVICPLFSLLWVIAGTLFAVFVNPFLEKFVFWISENLVYGFFIGVFIGMMVVDFAYSLHLGLLIKKFASDSKIKFDNFKTFIVEDSKKEGSKEFFPGLLISAKAHGNALKEELKRFIDNSPKPKKWWKKDK